MKYSNETIGKYVASARETLSAYMAMDASDLSICVSTGNKKIGTVLNVSLLPIVTCANCKGCKHYCYDIKACFAYPEVLKARARNTALYRKDSKRYFNQIRATLSRRKTNKYFRWHVAGDIPAYNYFDNMVQIARDFPDFCFWTYTKNYSVVNTWIDNNGKESIPRNLSIMFSKWSGMPLVNPHNMPTFACVMADAESKPDPRENHYCPGNCNICLKAKRGCPYGETTYCNEH